jgi:hypothetical protein
MSESLSRSLGQNGWGDRGLVVYSVMSPTVPMALLQPGPKDHHKDHHKRSILVLVEQQGVLVLALALSLYEPTAPEGTATLYIDKLDSSGFLDKHSQASASLPRCVLECLLSAILASMNKESLRLHVFARAQPQFLFPLSAKNPQKHVLGVGIAFFCCTQASNRACRNGPSFDGGPRHSAIYP